MSNMKRLFIIWIILIGIPATYLKVHNNWDILRHVGIHKFKLFDCVAQLADVTYGYKILLVSKDGYYVAESLHNPDNYIKIMIGNWEESYFEKVDCNVR